MIQTIQVRVAEYSPLVKRLLLFTFVAGMITNLPDILFNFYLLSMGFDNAVAGSLASILRLSGFLVGIPVGLAVDRFGGVRTVQTAAIVNIVVWACLLNVRDIMLIRALYFMSGIFFTAQAISILPMISRVTTPAQRPFLFGLNFSVLMTTGIVSALIGGRLPAWLSGWLQVDAMSDSAYRAAMYSVIGLCVAVLIVLRGMHAHIAQSQHIEQMPASGDDAYHVPHRVLIFRLFGRFILGFAGGIFYPFVNIFLRQQYHLADATVGTIIAILGIGATIGGLFVGRMIQWVGVRGGVLVAGIVAGCSTLGVLYPHPWVFAIVYSIFSFMVSFLFPLTDVLLMGMIAPSQRGVANSIANMLWSLGWAVAAWLSGWLQVTSGFFWPILISATASFLVGIWFWFIPFPVYAHATQQPAQPDN